MSRSQNAFLGSLWQAGQSLTRLTIGNLGQRPRSSRVGSGSVYRTPFSSRLVGHILIIVSGVQVNHCLQTGQRLRLRRVNQGIADRVPASARDLRTCARKIVGLIAFGVGRDPPDGNTQA
jgi:hypothetical protein